MQRAKTPNNKSTTATNDNRLSQRKQGEQSKFKYTVKETGGGDKAVDNGHLVNEEELNNNQLERKNANRNHKASVSSVDTDMVNRWTRTSIDQSIHQSTNQTSTPIYLHHPPSFDDSTYALDPNLIRPPKFTNNQLQQTNDDQANPLQLLQGGEEEMQLQLHEISIAEQRMEERRLKHKSRLSSRLSSDSTSTESTKEERLNKDLPYPEYVRYSFNWLPQDSEWRLICLRMIRNPWFERISMTAILINCITLGMYYLPMLKELLVQCIMMP